MNPDRAVSVFRLDVLFPHVGWLEYVTVGINSAGIRETCTLCHTASSFFRYVSVSNFPRVDQCLKARLYERDESLTLFSLPAPPEGGQKTLPFHAFSNETFFPFPCSSCRRAKEHLYEKTFTP